LSRKEQKLKKKPWITKRIYVNIHLKHKMYKFHFLMGDETMKQEYKTFASKLTKIKTAAKKEYYAKN